MKKISRSTKKSNKKALTLVLSVIAIFLVGTFALSKSNLLQKFSPQPAEIDVLNAETGTIRLGIPDPSPALTLNTVATLPINIVSGTTKVAAVQVELTYDPTKIEIISVTPNAVDFPTVLAAPVIDKTAKKVTFVVGVDPASGGKAITPAIKLATFNVKPLASGAISIAFGNATQAAAVGFSTNMLASVNDLTVTVAGGTASPSPSAAASPSPSPSAAAKKTDFVAPVGVDLQDWNSMSSVWDVTGTTPGTPGSKKQDVAGANNSGPDGLVNNYDMSVLIKEFNK